MKYVDGRTLGEKLGIAPWRGLIDQVPGEWPDERPRNPLHCKCGMSTIQIGHHARFIYSNMTDIHRGGSREAIIRQWQTS